MTLNHLREALAAPRPQMRSGNCCYRCGRPAVVSLNIAATGDSLFQPVCEEHDWTGVSRSIMVRRSDLEALIEVADAARALIKGWHDYEQAVDFGDPQAIRLENALDTLIHTHDHSDKAG